DPLDDLAQETGAVLQRASVGSFARVGAEELMAQIAVAVLQVEELEPEFTRETSRADIISNDAADLSICEERVVRRDAELAVQDRMAIQDARLHPVLPVRPAEPPRMRELEP